MPRSVWLHIVRLIEQRGDVTHDEYRESIGYIKGHGGR